MDDLKKQILQDIKLTGFVSELNIGSELIRLGWNVSHSEAYYDFDSGKSRELDIIAMRRWMDEKLRFCLFIQLVTQVKFSKRPWIIFSSASSKETIGWSIVHATENFVPHIHLPFPQIGIGIMRENYPRRGLAFHEAFKEPNQTSQIFESIVTACKAASYRASEYQLDKISDGSDDDIFSINQNHYLYLFVPVIVLDGHLFEAYLDENGDVQLDEKNFIPVDFNYTYVDIHNQNKKGEETSSNHYYPDVITISGLKEYSALVINWGNTIFKKASECLREDIASRSSS